MSVEGFELTDETNSEYFNVQRSTFCKYRVCVLNAATHIMCAFVSCTVFSSISAESQRKLPARISISIILRRDGVTSAKLGGLE